MKIRLAILVIISASSFVVHAGISSELSVKGADAKVVLRVVDQDGVSVSDAKIRGGFSAYYLKDSVIVDGVTNTNGEFVVQGKCNEFLRIDVTKTGYYHTEEKINLRRSIADPIVVDGGWQPYGETRTVVLKRIKILGQLSVPDMGNLAVRERKIPKMDCWIPFDLEKFDWTAPYGKGVYSDVLLRLHNRTTSNYFDYTDRMEICFTNNPFAGAYAAPKESYSDMKTCYVAISNAVYASRLTFICERTANNKLMEKYLNDDEYLVFRTRTSVDEQGNLKSAHYGIIYGAWFSAGDHIRFSDGCFNPVENSCYVEDSYYLREAVKHYKDFDTGGEL